MAGRKKSLLSKVGDDAMRAALLRTLVEKDWNLTAASTALEMAGPGNVLRSIKMLGLVKEYEAGYRASDGPARQAPPPRPSHAPRVCSLGTVCVQPRGPLCSVAVVTDSNAPRSVHWRAEVALTNASLVESCASGG